MRPVSTSRRLDTDRYLCLKGAATASPVPPAIVFDPTPTAAAPWWRFWKRW